MCVVQRSQKQKRERERERERDDEKRMLAILSRSLCSSFLRLFFVEMRWSSFFLLLLCVSFFKNFSRICLTDALEKNDSLTKKKRIRLLLLKKDIEKRCECEICRNEKQRRRIRRVVLNGRVLRASTREEEDVTMRVKGLIVAYGRRTWTREAWMFPRFRFRRIP